MNKAQKKIIIILCFILAGLLIIGVFIDWSINGFYIDKYYNPFSDFKVYTAVILIALALFLRKGWEKKE